MIDYAKLLEKNPHGVLATRNGDGIETRVFRCLYAEDGKLYFCTEASKPVSAQLSAHPKATYCVVPQDFDPVLSLKGTVVFVDDPETRTRAFRSFPMLEKRYGTPANPDFKVFYLLVEEAGTYSMSEGAKTYRA